MIPNFDAFYQAVHGNPPFPWQSRLAARAVAGDWPDTLALPTASGKTSAIDVAVYALAAQADAAHRTAAVRIAFVVDRRVVADEAFTHAQKLQAALESATAGVVRDIADRLRKVAGARAERPLEVTLLRGGVHRDETWAKTPVQPTVVVSTVDQVGSRLLFRGYGLPARSRPIHAGLLGLDTLLLLDEAHLSAAFVDTARYVATLQAAAPAGGALPAPLRVIEMTATPRQAGQTLALDAEDRRNAVLQRRLAASKPVTTELIDDGAFVARIAEHANAAAKEGKVVGVIVNRVDTARRVFAAISGDQKLLITGRSRSWSREEALEASWDLINADRDGSARFVVVATQAVEVGANLDFDHLITEVAPLDALRQRFGRLNRVGKRGAITPARIVARRSDVVGKNAGKDPIYGDRPAAVWAWLTTAGFVADFGVDALAAHFTDRPDAAASLSTPRPGEAQSDGLVRSWISPVLPAHVRAWSRTSPAPVPDPAVAPFLHGPAAFDADDVQVVWRAGLPEPSPENEELWVTALRAVPPRVGETVALPRTAVARWLEGGKAPPLSDLEGAARDDELSTRDPRTRAVLVWGGPDDHRVAASPRDIRPGETIVVPSAWGGLRDGVFDPESDGPVPDLAEYRPRVPTGGVGGREPRRWVRLDPELLASLTEVARLEGLDVTLPDRDAVTAAYKALAEARDDLDAHRAAEDRLKALFQLDRWFAGTGFKLDDLRPATLTLDGEHATYQVQIALAEREAYAFSDDDDSSHLGVGTHQLGLDAHNADVALTASDFAAAAPVDAELRASIRRAGFLHDLGKADPRFQAWLGGGVWGGGELFAKSPAKRTTPAAVREARARSGYPRGARHELLSVALAASNPDVALGVGVDRELVLHLVGAHHGYGRGLPPEIPDPSPQTVQVTAKVDGQTIRLAAPTRHALGRLDAGWVERFAALERRYGPWGLAWLEAVLRLADHRASEKPGRSEGSTP